MATVTETTTTQAIFTFEDIVKIMKEWATVNNHCEASVYPPLKEGGYSASKTGVNCDWHDSLLLELKPHVCDSDPWPHRQCIPRNEWATRLRQLAFDIGTKTEQELYINHMSHLLYIHAHGKRVGDKPDTTTASIVLH